MRLYELLDKVNLKKTPVEIISGENQYNQNSLSQGFVPDDVLDGEIESVRTSGIGRIVIFVNGLD